MATMIEDTTTYLDGLLATLHPFQPCAFFDQPMDQLVYLKCDAPFRADRIDEYLTLLWEVGEARLIGVKIKGFRSLFEDMKREGLVQEGQFFLLCEAISRLLSRVVERDDSNELRRMRATMYSFAKDVAGDYRVSESNVLAA